MFPCSTGCCLYAPLSHRLLSNVFATLYLIIYGSNNPAQSSLFFVALTIAGKEWEMCLQGDANFVQVAMAVFVRGQGSHLCLRPSKGQSDDDDDDDP